MDKTIVKKIAWMITISTMAVTFASASAYSVSALEYTDVTDKYVNEIDELSDYGIVKGINALQFGGEKKVERQQMALFISRAITGNTADDIFESNVRNVFNDINNLQYLSAIMYCQGNKIINGVSSNKFNPTGYITYQDAITMVCRAIGLSGVAELSYPDGYIKFAENNGITAGIDGVGYTEEIDRYTAAKLIYNMLYTKSFTGLTVKKPIVGGGYTENRYSSSGKVINTHFGLTTGRYIITGNDEYSIDGKIASTGNVIVSRIWDDNGYINGSFDEQGEVNFDDLNIDIEYDKCIGTQIEITAKSDFGEVYESRIMSNYNVYSNNTKGIKLTKSTMTVDGVSYDIVKSYTKGTTKTGKDKTNEIIIYNGSKIIDAVSLNDIMDSNEFELIIVNDNETRTNRAVVRKYDVGEYVNKNGSIYIGNTLIGDEDKVEIRSSYRLHSGDYIRYSYDAKAKVISVSAKYNVVKGTVTKISGTSVFIDGTEYRVADNRGDLVLKGNSGLRENMNYEFVVSGRKIVAITKEVDGVKTDNGNKTDTEDIIIKTEFDNDGYFVPVMNVNYDLYQSLLIKDSIMSRINEYANSDSWGYVGYYLNYFVSSGNIAWDIINNADRYDEALYLDFIIANLIYRTDTVTSEVLKNSEYNSVIRKNLLGKAESVLRTVSSGSITKYSEAGSDIMRALYALMDPDNQLGEISSLNDKWKDYVVALSELGECGVDMSNCVQVVFGYFDGMPAVAGLTKVDDKSAWYYDTKVDNYELYRYTKNDDGTLKAYRLTDYDSGVVVDNNKKNVYTAVGNKVIYSEQNMDYTRVTGHANERGLIIQKDSVGKMRFNSSLIDMRSQKGSVVKNSYVITDNTTLFVNMNNDISCVSGARIGDIVIEDDSWYDMTLILDSDGVVVTGYIVGDGLSKVTQSIIYETKQESDAPAHVYITSLVSALDGGGYMYEGLKFKGTKAVGTSYVYSESRLSVGDTYKVNKDSEKGTVLLVESEINYTYAEVQSVNNEYMIVKHNGTQKIVHKEKNLTVWLVNYSESGDAVLRQVDTSYITYGAVIAFPCDDIETSVINSVIIVALA